MLKSVSLCLKIIVVAGILSHASSQQSHNGVTLEAWPPATKKNPTVQDLHREYSQIFRFGNRNAASHLWSTFLLERSAQMVNIERFEFFMAGYCAVSGSPVRPSDYTRYRLTLPHVAGEELFSGYMYYCCWPCVCDTQDFIRVDTYNVTTSDGLENIRHFAVIGNPCDNPERLSKPFVQPASYGSRTTTLRDAAPEVRCNDKGELEGATLSDNGYVIIAMLFDTEPVTLLPTAIDSTKSMEVYGSSSSVPLWDGIQTPGRLSKATTSGNSNEAVVRMFHDEREWETMCQDRAKNGYQSGMGEIFRRVSSISPIEIGTKNVLPSSCRPEDGMECTNFTIQQ